MADESKTKQVPGFFILPDAGGVLDVSKLTGTDGLRRVPLRLRDSGLGGLIVETITGGVPDASDQLPEGTIIVSP